MQTNTALKKKSSLSSLQSPLELNSKKCLEKYSWNNPEKTQIYLSWVACLSISAFLGFARGDLLLLSPWCWNFQKVVERFLKSNMAAHIDFQQLGVWGRRIFTSLRSAWLHHEFQDGLEYNVKFCLRKAKQTKSILSLIPPHGSESCNRR